MVESMDPSFTFLLYENLKGKKWFPGFPESAPYDVPMYRLSVIIQNLGLQNMQTILCSVLWPVYNIYAFHTLVWTVYNIQTTIHHHL